jgi:predicted nucleic acid-binding protein
VPRLSYLVDTDIIIDWLHGRTHARQLLLSDDVRLYCSAVTRKELLSKTGLKDSERRRILGLLRTVRVLEVDSLIAASASELLQKYADQPLGVADALIAATAWTRHLPLVTRNRKHYDFVEEITVIDPR